MAEICNITHGLPYNLFWPHKRETCHFMERLSQQRLNISLIDKVIIEGKNIKDPIDVSSLGVQVNLFQNKQTIRHQDIVKLVDQAIKKMKTRTGPKRNWNVEEISILIWVVCQFQHFYQSQFYKLNLDIWDTISSYIPGKNRNQCLFKALKSQKMMLSEHPWKKQQQIILQELVAEYEDKDWNKISQDLYFKSHTPNIYRLPKQCRQHWSSYLVNELKKGPWQMQEDISLLEMVMKTGKKWTEIGKYLIGRTQNAIKNRCNLLLTKYQTIHQDTNFNYNIRNLILKIKLQHQMKLTKKSSKKLKSRNSLKSLNQISQSNILSQQIFQQKKNLCVIKQQLLMRQQQRSIQINRQQKVSLVELIELNEQQKLAGVVSLTNIDRNFLSIDEFQNIQLSSFHNSDVGKFLLMEQYPMDNIQSYSFNHSFQ